MTPPETKRARPALLEYFWPRQTTDQGFSDARARMLCGFSGIIGFMALLHNLHVLITDPNASLATLAGSALCILGYFILPALWHRTHNMVLCNVAIQILYFAHTNMQLFTDTQYVWRQEIFLIGPPVLALLLVGSRAAWIVTAAVCINLLVISLVLDSYPFSASAVVSVVAVTLMVGLSLFESEIRRKERRLIELRDIAQKADREKSEFLAKMSHEIRTPLNGLSGILQLLNETDLTEDQKHLVATGQESGRSLMRLINNVLDYSKMAAHGVVVESIAVNSAELVTGVANAQLGAAKSKGLEVTVDVAPEVPEWILSDPTRVSQVITNLVGNAIKFTKDGRIDIHVTSLRSPDGSGLLKLSVIDTGIGLTQSAQERVFNKFEQAHADTNRQFGGTGLGLAISKEIVELMGGEIGVSSAPYQGSTFWFTLPLVETDAPPELNAEPKPQKADFDGLAILVVEDNKTNQMIVQRFLESMKVTVTVVEDGRPAVALCGQQHFDLILMDIQLPEMDGITATEILRKTEGPNQSTPIVALSANILPEQTKSYMRAGMNACLGKPFRKDELAKMMGELVRKKSSKQPAA